MAQLRPSILYALLVLGGVLASTGLIYGIFYDSEKFDGNRYQHSYQQFSQALLTDKQKQAITLLQSKGVEWAHFRFIEAIKNDDTALVMAFIDAGMPLNSNSILLEIALGSSKNKKAMLVLLNRHYQLDFNALYRLPGYVSVFDRQLANISTAYIQQQKIKFRELMITYKKSHGAWEEKLANKKQQMLSVCKNDACRGGRINDVRRMFEASKPIEPVANYITKERAYVSLFTIAAWQKDSSLIKFIQQQGGELIANKLFLTDAKLIYFTIDKEGHALIVEKSSIEEE
ncbi:MAG: hypothetical protein COB62_01320 [Piscirickettsiaceae bacterium]|nr:MAG: hypothetical protein COB62_01320 [Piscirickettsiaceae bacterium]